MEPATFLVLFLMVFVLTTLLLGPRDFHRVDRAHELLAHGSTLVDVDSPEEFNRGHPPGAINIPLEELEQRYGALDPTHVVIVHGHWFRAWRATRELQAHGYYVLSLGSAWS